MSTSGIYRVTYHFEKSGRRVSDTFQDNILASGQDFNSLNAVLSSNGKLQAGCQLVIDAVGHVGNVLS